MSDSVSVFDWALNIVLACITCERVILLTKPNEDQRAAQTAFNSVIQSMPVQYNQVKRGDKPFNIFLPTVCSSCDGAVSWKSLSINKSFMATWQPYLAMSTFLEGDLSMLGSTISLVRFERIMSIIAPDYVIRSVVVNPSSGAAAQVQPHLQSGFI